MISPVVILNNIRSLYNVGSIFRTAEAFGVAKLYLCGITGTPENPRLAKTALAGLDSVDWEYKKSAIRTVKWLKTRGYYIVCLEIAEKSVPIHHLPDRSLALVVGHERSGIDQSILALADEIVCIPMLGRGNSLNVAVAFGIAAYSLLSDKN